MIHIMYYMTTRAKGKPGKTQPVAFWRTFSKFTILLSETIVKQKSYQVGRYGVTVSTNSKCLNICILLLELYRYSCLPQMNVPILFRLNNINSRFTHDGKLDTRYITDVLHNSFPSFTLDQFCSLPHERMLWEITAMLALLRQYLVNHILHWCRLQPFNEDVPICSLGFTISVR